MITYIVVAVVVISIIYWPLTQLIKKFSHDIADWLDDLLDHPDFQDVHLPAHMVPEVPIPKRTFRDEVVDLAKKLDSVATAILLGLISLPPALVGCGFARAVVTKKDLADFGFTWHGEKIT